MTIRVALRMQPITGFAPVRRNGHRRRLQRLAETLGIFPWAAVKAVPVATGVTSTTAGVYCHLTATLNYSAPTIPLNNSVYLNPVGGGSAPFSFDQAEEAPATISNAAIGCFTAQPGVPVGLSITNDGNGFTVNTLSWELSP